MHGSILPTESTKTGCFCAHTRVHTEQAGHENALKQHRSKYTKNLNTESTYNELAYLVPSFRTFVTQSTGFPNQ